VSGKPLSISQRCDVVERFMQLFFIERNRNVALGKKASRRRNLMIVTMFVINRATRHDDDRLAQLERGDDGTHPRVRNYGACLFDLSAAITRINKRRPFYMLRPKRRRTNLRKNLRARISARPFIHRDNQSINRKLRSDRYEELHSTAPS
jgi:hypothetical protein